MSSFASSCASIQSHFRCGKFEIGHSEQRVGSDLLDGFGSFRMAVLVGCSSGALAQFLASPTDLVKVMMQADGKRKLEGKPKRY